MHGTGVTISLVPNQGFRVKKWINVDSFSGLTGRINMNADRIVQINLERTSVSVQSTPRPTFAVATRTPRPTSTPRPTPLPTSTPRPVPTPTAAPLTGIVSVEIQPRTARLNAVLHG